MTIALLLTIPGNRVTSSFAQMLSDGLPELVSFLSAVLLSTGNAGEPDFWVHYTHHLLFLPFTV
jgi:hypothetical protein